MQKLYFACVSSSLILGLISYVEAAPLSCGMKRELVTVSAQLRDIGVPQQDVRAKLIAPGELTREEVDAILKVAYGSMKTVPPETIGKTVYNLCTSAQRH